MSDKEEGIRNDIIDASLFQELRFDALVDENGNIVDKEGSCLGNALQVTVSGGGKFHVLGLTTLNKPGQVKMLQISLPSKRKRMLPHEADAAIFGGTGSFAPMYMGPVSSDDRIIVEAKAVNGLQQLQGAFIGHWDTCQNPTSSECRVVEHHFRGYMGEADAVVPLYFDYIVDRNGDVLSRSGELIGTAIEISIGIHETFHVVGLRTLVESDRVDLEQLVCRGSNVLPHPVDAGRYNTNDPFVPIDIPDLGDVIMYARARQHGSGDEKTAILRGALFGYWTRTG
jgi:hypothetical protein